MEAFDKQVSLNSNKPAIIFQEDQITYEDLAKRSKDLAQYLTSFVRETEVIIPLILERTPDIIVSILAILRIGGAFLPISPITPCSRIQFILEDTKASLVICNTNLDKNLSKNIHIINPSKIESTSSYSKLSAIQPNSLAYVMYTSGSTGYPKGVLIEHHSMMHLFLSLISELSITKQDEFLALTDYTFDISLIELLMPLLTGATVILTTQGTVADGLKISRYLEQNNITCMQATPLTWEILLKQGWKNDGQMKILVGGEKFNSQLAESLIYTKGNIWNMYGPTETSMWSMINHISKPLFTDSVPLGKPINKTIIKILDQQLNEVATGVQGELYIGGEGLARGYLNNQELTQEKFIFHSPEKVRLYKSGDLAITHDQNTVCYIDRIDDQLKFGGIRIEAGEIVSAIQEEPLVKKAVVKMHEIDGYYKSLAAYVEMDEKKIFSGDLENVNTDVSCFLKNIYDTIYLQAADYEHGTINNCGWQSSFTGSVISVEELSETYQWIRNLIHESDLSDVLEVGCGTGSLLLDYIDKAEECTVMEISSEAISYVKNRLNKEQLNKIIFRNESALNINAQKKHTCIIINSVIQYLPSVEILINLITKLITATKPNGSIIIGDVRSLELMDICFLEKIRRKNQEKKSLDPNLGAFYYKCRDSEIVLSPKFFYALKNRFNEISHVDISVKNGVHKNELNYFRYDVILHIKKTIHYQSPTTILYSPLLTVDNLKSTITLSLTRPIVIKKIPNTYIQEFIDVINAEIPHYHALSSHKLEICSEEVNNINAITHLDFTTHNKFIFYGDSSPINTVDMHLYPREKKQLVRCADDSLVKDSYRNYCREPFNPWLQKYCFDRIKSKICKNIVSWVYPSVYIWVERWPVSINGKLDKRKLTLPSHENIQFTAKENTLEKLQIIWKNITGNYAVSNEEFWVHGVSSLCMYFFLATINETFPVKINYNEFRNYDNLTKLANYIDAMMASSCDEYSFKE